MTDLQFVVTVSLALVKVAVAIPVVTSHSIVEPPEPREHRNTGTQEHGNTGTQEHATWDIDVSLLRN